MRLAAGSRSRCWLLKGADDTVHDSWEAAAAHLQRSTSAAQRGAHSEESRPSRADPSQAEPSRAEQSQPSSVPGLKIEEVFVCSGAGAEHPGRARGCGERQPLAPSAAPHARSSLTGRRSKFIWAPEKGNACV